MHFEAPLLTASRVQRGPEIRTRPGAKPAWGFWFGFGVHCSLGFGVWGLGFGVWGLGFGAWGLGLGAWGLGFGVWGLGGVGLGV